MSFQEITVKFINLSEVFRLNNYIFHSAFRKIVYLWRKTCLSIYC